MIHTLNENRYRPGKLGDFVIYCDICGCPCLYSESTKLDSYTGRGGLLVCPTHADPIDYGLVPYKIQAEKPIPETRTNHYQANPSAVPTIVPAFDTGTEDPMSTGQVYGNWEDITDLWENISNNWEQM